MSKKPFYFTYLRGLNAHLLLIFMVLGKVLEKGVLDMYGHGSEGLHQMGFQKLGGQGFNLFRAEF